MRLLLPCLMVSEFGGASQLFTTIKIKVEVKINHLHLTCLYVTQSISSLPTTQVNMCILMLLIIMAAME